MFTLLCGRAVHGALTGPEMLMATMTQPAPSVAVERPELPQAIVEVVDRALAFEPSERFADAHQMQQAVRRAYYVTMGSSVVPELRTSVAQDAQDDEPVAQARVSPGELGHRTP